MSQVKWLDWGHNDSVAFKLLPTTLSIGHFQSFICYRSKWNPCVIPNLKNTKKKIFCRMSKQHLTPLTLCVNFFNKMIWRVCVGKYIMCWKQLYFLFICLLLSKPLSCSCITLKLWKCTFYKWGAIVLFRRIYGYWQEHWVLFFSHDVLCWQASAHIRITTWDLNVGKNEGNDRCSFPPLQSWNSA